MSGHQSLQLDSAQQGLYLLVVRLNTSGEISGIDASMPDRDAVVMNIVGGDE